VDSTSRATAASGSLANPNGCWDWIGWYGSNFAQRAGTQVAAIKAMVDRLSSGTGGGGGGGGGTTLAAPTGVATSGATAGSMVVAWAGVSGAAGYHVYRNGSRVTAAPVAATSFTDSGLASATTYSWTVTAVDANGAESAASAPATGTTTGTVAATCFTASNYAHTTASRARVSGGYALANGSNQNMGLGASVYPREVVKRALALNAAAVIFYHNHPSGVSEPSQSDQRLTQRLKAALGTVDIRVLDHFVVGSAEALSFTERGLL